MSTAQVLADSVRRFAQGFYDWYVPLALKDNTHPAEYEVLTQRPSVLSSQLLAALRADSIAAVRTPGEIVGIDWDPFLNSQDPCERYEVRRVTLKHRTYWVEVSCAGARRKDPDVVAELGRRNGTWIFVNFHDPHNHVDLLTSLRALARSRAKARH